MNRNYWERIAPDYDEEIFDVLLNDKKSFIRSAIRKFASPSRTVIDVGCAVGKWIPILSPAFKKVYALDISARNLAIAKARHSQLHNVEYLRVDMSNLKTKKPRADLCICINAVLTASLKKRINFFRSLSKSIKKGGHLILVIPSLESYLLTLIVSHRWKIDKNILFKPINANRALKNWDNIRQGNVDIDHIPTKHFLKEELNLLLDREGLVVEAFRKIEYDWNTEFLQPPAWLKSPYPWDWMCVAKKL